MSLDVDRQALEGLAARPTVVQLSGQEVEYDLGPTDFLVAEMRAALARPLGHTPLALPALRLVGKDGALLEDGDILCDVAANGAVTVVIDASLVSELESPANWAVAVALKHAEREGSGRSIAGRSTRRRRP